MADLSLLLVVSILILVISVPKACAQEPTADIYPSKGSVFTDIYLQVRYDYMEDGQLYLFWDGLLILEDVAQNFQTGFDVHFYPPNIYPYSELGNHSIHLQIWYNVIVEEPRIHKEPRFYNSTLTFEIVQYFPPTSEWWEWWESVPDEIKQDLVGPQGEKGEKGDTGPYPLEAVLLNLGLSSASVIVSVIALNMVYKMKKERQ